MSSVAAPTPQRESEGWGLLAGLVFFSAVVHAGTLVLMPTAPPVAPARTVEMEFYEPPKPPPPPPEVKPEPPKPLEPPKAKPPPVKLAEPRPPPKEEAPPPPNDEPPPKPTAPVPIVVGISMSSTTAGGDFAVQVGNTSYGKASDKIVDPKDVKAYAAPKYAPPGGVDTEPSVLDEPKVPYPEEAKKADVEGTVRLKLKIDAEGVVQEVAVINGPGYGLDEAARDAVRRFRFKPATKGGVPIGYTFIYNFTFLLD